MDVFTVQAVDMISLTNIKVGHEGQGHGIGWFLDKVVIKESSQATNEFVFNCNRYVSQVFIYPGFHYVKAYTSYNGNYFDM